jgi:hypothetical protein
MKARSIITFLVLFLLLPVIQLHAGRGGGMRGGGGMRPMQAPAPQPQPAATNAPAKVIKPGQNKFGDLTNTMTFYFLADTNKSYLWVKISSTSASNTVSKSVVTLQSSTMVNSQ